MDWCRQLALIIQPVTIKGKKTRDTNAVSNTHKQGFARSISHCVSEVGSGNIRTVKSIINFNPTG